MGHLTRLSTRTAAAAAGALLLTGDLAGPATASAPASGVAGRLRRLPQRLSRRRPADGGLPAPAAVRPGRAEQPRMGHRLRGHLHLQRVRRPLLDLRGGRRRHHVLARGHPAVLQRLLPGHRVCHPLRLRAEGGASGRLHAQSHLPLPARGGCQRGAPRPGRLHLPLRRHHRLPYICRTSSLARVPSASSILWNSPAELVTLTSLRTSGPMRAQLGHGWWKNSQSFPPHTFSSSGIGT